MSPHARSGSSQLPFRPNPGICPPDLARRATPPAPLVRAPIYLPAALSRSGADPRAADQLWARSSITWERPRPRVRLLRLGGVLLMVAGAAAVAYVLHTVRVGAAGAGAAQQQLAAELAAELTTTAAPAADFAADDPTMAAPAQTTTTGGAPAVTAPLQSTTTTTLAPALLAASPPLEGQPVGRLQIPAAGVDWVIVEGVNPQDLAQGPGHMPGTALPGQPGNAVVSGHRTTNGAPFYDLDALQPGDLITIETPIGIHTYEVVEVLTVAPSDLWVTSQVEGAWLTLTTCHPRYTARERLIVFARLIAGPNTEAINATLDGSQTPPRPPA